MLQNLRNLSRTSRKPFSYKRQVALLFFGILGFTVAGAWVLAFNTLIKELFQGWNEILVYFIYAVAVTIASVVLLWCLVKATDYFEA